MYKSNLDRSFIAGKFGAIISLYEALVDEQPTKLHFYRTRLHLSFFKIAFQASPIAGTLPKTYFNILFHPEVFRSTRKGQLCPNQKL